MMAGGAQPGVDHRRHRSLAVGAGDVDRSKTPLGMAEPGDDRQHVVETELDPELPEAEEVGERIGHRSRYVDGRVMPSATSTTSTTSTTFPGGAVDAGAGS